MMNSAYIRLLVAFFARPEIDELVLHNCPSPVDSWSWPSQAVMRLMQGCYLVCLVRALAHL